MVVVVGTAVVGDVVRVAVGVFIVRTAVMVKAAVVVIVVGAADTTPPTIVLLGDSVLVVVGTAAVVGTVLVLSYEELWLCFF